MQDLDLLAAELEAGMIERERIPWLAAELMVAGFDTPSLRVAAGLMPDDLDDAEEVFRAALAELGVAREDDGQGDGAALAREIATRGVDGRLPALDAAATLHRLAADLEGEPWTPDGQWRSDVLALLEDWEDEPTQRPALEAQLRAELESLLRRLGPARRRRRAT
jgi:hypothetical protein